MQNHLLKSLENQSNIEVNLKSISEQTTGKIVFSTSFGIEDQVISHIIFQNKIKNIEVFTLDTGRLFPQTYAVWDKTILQYEATIKAYYPSNEKAEIYVNANGINAFYNSVELRKECCYIRKVEPLNRALKDVTIWITGLRAEQSENRNNLKKVQWDEERQLYKYNPLLDWTTQDIVSFLKNNGVPYNTLHDENFVSLGCAPCTRATKPEEDFRAGRWWWEDKSKKECGLHR